MPFESLPPEEKIKKKEIAAIRNKFESLEIKSQSSVNIQKNLLAIVTTFID